MKPYLKLSYMTLSDIRDIYNPSRILHMFLNDLCKLNIINSWRNGSVFRDYILIFNNQEDLTAFCLKYL